MTCGMFGWGHDVQYFNMIFPILLYPNANNKYKILLKIDSIILKYFG
jgi:hypothetical protein